jgi:hypothetical protein
VLQWAKAHAKPHISAYRSISTPEHPDEYISLIERYLQLVPDLLPDLSRTTLSHPDLHLDNIFVDPDTKKITCIIDWQSASVSEPVFQESMLLMLTPLSPRKTREGEESVPDENADRTNHLLAHYRHLTQLEYKTGTETAKPNIEPSHPLAEPTSLLTGCWTRNDLYSFRHKLIYIAATWGKGGIDADIPCPLGFSQKELDDHGEELELLEVLREALTILQDVHKIPLEGRVRRED